MAASKFLNSSAFAVASGIHKIIHFFSQLSAGQVLALWHTCLVTIWVARTKVQNYIKEW